MPLSLVERRRAREFAHALDSGRTHDRELAPLLGISAVLGEVGAEIPPVRPEFRAALRRDLMELGAALEAERALAATAGAATRGHRARPNAPRRTAVLSPARRRAAALGVALGVIAGAMATTAMASQAALPGDRLYGMKRTVEDVRLQFARSEAARGQQHLSMASNRLNEVSQLLEESGPGPMDAETVHRIGSTIDAMTASTKAGRELLVDAYQQTHDPAPLARLMEFSRSQGKQIRGIAPMLPGELSPSPGAMLALLNDIATQVSNLSPSSVALPEYAQLLPLGETGLTPSAGPTGSSGSGPNGAGLPGHGAQTILSGGIGGEPGDASLGVGVEAGEGGGPLPTANASVGVQVPGLPLPNVGVNLLGVSLSLDG